MLFRSDDGSLTPNTALWRWSNYLLEAGKKLGRPVNAAEQYKKWVEAAGFVDIHEEVHKWPQNPWAKHPRQKEIGLWTMTDMLEGLHGLSMGPFTRASIMNPEEVEVFLADVRRDVKNPKIRSYWSM